MAGSANQFGEPSDLRPRCLDSLTRLIQSTAPARKSAQGLRKCLIGLFGYPAGTTIRTTTQHRVANSRSKLRRAVDQGVKVEG